MYESRDRHVRIFAAGIGHLERGSDSFFDSRDDLSADRAIGVVWIDEVKKMRRDGEAQLMARQQHPGPLFRGELDFGFEIFQAGDAIFQLPLPIIPKFSRDIGPEARNVRTEPLVSGLNDIMHDKLTSWLRVEARLTMSIVGHPDRPDVMFAATQFFRLHECAKRSSMVKSALPRARREHRPLLSFSI